jgi:hypothetical protein
MSIDLPITFDLAAINSQKSELGCCSLSQFVSQFVIIYDI